jgi:hypothetical protein
MRQKLISYTTEPDRAEENKRLIERVFVELHAKSPEGIRYLVLKLEGNSFLHLVAMETEEGVEALRRLEAFRRFQSGIADRCSEALRSAEATIVGNYRMLRQ